MSGILYTKDGTPVENTNPLPIKPVDADGDEKFTDANPASVKLTAGTALAGKVSIDQTTPGTTNGVQVNAALPAGDNNIGNVDIASAIPAGTNLIGKTGIDQTTPGTTNAVQLTGSSLAEQLTEADAVANVLTFAANIVAIDIYHEEATRQEFIVNGLTLQIPAGGYATLIGGTPAATVTIPAGINCIVGRLT